MAYEALATISPGDTGTSAWANKVKGNFDALAVKELWVPVTHFSEYSVDVGVQLLGNYPLAVLASTNDTAGLSFKVPYDFGAIVEAKVVVIPTATQASANWDITISYAAIGQSSTTHTGTLTSSTYNVTSGQLYGIDISGGLASLAVGDYAGVKMGMGTAGHTVNVLGLYLKYSIAGA
jgi:hypothetical protein